MPYGALPQRVEHPATSGVTGRRVNRRGHETIQTTTSPRGTDTPATTVTMDTAGTTNTGATATA